MWLKYLLATLLFYFFAVLQNSFLVHFNIFGIVPNFILIFCFILIYFSAQGEPASGWENYFYAITAGFFLDVFSHLYFGISIVSLLILAFSTKKALQILWDRRGGQSVFVFLPLFIAFLIIYSVFSNISLLIFSPSFASFDINWTFIIFLAYNLLFALLGFYACQKLNIFKDSDRQLKLFK